jgi:hypothetical protein
MIDLDDLLRDIETGEVDYGQEGQRHGWFDLGEIVDKSDIREMIAYIRKLEGIALDADGYRCEACRLVFDCNDVAFGEDCTLCKPCAYACRQGEAAS